MSNENVTLGEDLGKLGLDVIIKEHCVLVDRDGTIGLTYYAGQTIDGRVFYIVQRESNDWKAETAYSAEDVRSLF